MHLVIKWIMCLHPLLTKKLLKPEFWPSIRGFQVGLLLFTARLGKTVRLLVSCEPTVSRGDPLHSDSAVL